MCDDAVAAFPAPEDAEQNAALMAIVYIEGGLAEDCTLCTLTRVGQAALPGWTPVQVNSPGLPSHAQLVKVLEERMDALRTRQACPFQPQMQPLVRPPVLNCKDERTGQADA